MLNVVVLVIVIGDCVILGMRFRDNIDFHRQSVVVKDGFGHRRTVFRLRLRSPPHMSGVLSGVLSGVARRAKTEARRAKTEAAEHDALYLGTNKHNCQLSVNNSEFHVLILSSVSYNGSSLIPSNGELDSEFSAAKRALPDRKETLVIAYDSMAQAQPNTRAIVF